MSKALRTPTEIAHAYAFTLDSLRKFLEDDTIYEDKDFRKVDGQMLQRRLDGMSMPAIAAEFGVSSERVRQRTTRMLVHCMHTRQRRRTAWLDEEKRGKENEAGKGSYSCSEAVAVRQGS